MVIRIAYGNLVFLFPGDLEKDGERFLVGMNSDLRCDVILCPHHGKKTSSSREFLNAANPRVVVVSTRSEGKRGGPDPAVIERYHDLGAKIFQTDTHGAIMIQTNGYTLKTKSMINDEKP